MESASSGVPAKISKFFKNRKKNPELFFFSKDGSAMVSKDKGGQEATIPFTQFSLKTSEELLASYEQRAQAIKEQQELFDVAMRALLDARERGASDFELLALNRECQRLDSYLFELNWAEKEMKAADPIPEFRQLEFTNPYLVNKPKEPVYIFTARRVTVDFPYKYEQLPAAGSATATALASTATAAGAAAAAAVAVPLPPAVLERASVAASATETRRLDGEEPIEFFYKLENPYKVFSLSYSAAFSLDGKVWPTVTHYFQAQKFPSDPVYQETIRTSKRPEEAKKLGKTIDRPVRPDFELYMDDIMRRALAAKFDQNPPLKKLLTDTGNKTLIDVDPTDPYWGMGKDRKGKNKLGQMLMELRDKFRSDVAVAGAAAAAAVATAPLAPAAVSVAAEKPRTTAAAIPKGTKVRISSRPPQVPVAPAAAAAAAPAPATTEFTT
jgi:ribA/ribD-fused uncharacterized protein